MENFYQKLKKPFFILAPMEDVTDVVFRKVIDKAAAPDIYFTEFTNSASFNHSDGIKSLKGRLFKDNEKNLVAHIWGDKPEDFAVMAKAMREMGFIGVDINMGCPAPNVVKDHKGAYLMLRFDKASKIIKAAKAGGLPVSVKTRLGYYELAEYRAWITHLLKQDLANLSIHLRTKKEESKVAAHYEYIADIMQLRDEIAPKTTITINGDIKDYQAGMKLYEKYQVDGIMIGRGVFANPFAFAKDNYQPTTKDLLELFKTHLELYIHYTDLEPSLKRPLHRFFKIYIKEFNGAAALRNQLMETKTAEEALAVINKFEYNV